MNWVTSNYTWVGAEEPFLFELGNVNYTWVGAEKLFWLELSNVQLYLGGSGGTILD